MFFSTANMQHQRCIIIHQTWTLTVRLLWTIQILRLYKVCRQFVQVISIFLYLFISLSPFLFLSLTLHGFFFRYEYVRKKIETVKERGRDWEGMWKNWKEEMGGGCEWDPPESQLPGAAIWCQQCHQCYQCHQCHQCHQCLLTTSSPDNISTQHFRSALHSLASSTRKAADVCVDTSNDAHCASRVN